MALAKRIIPVLLMRHGLLVKGKQFDSMRTVGVAQQAAEIYQARGADELIVLDVAATEEKRGPDILAMKRLTEVCFMPVAVGGGITTVDQVRELLANGADKVVIGTAAVLNPNLIEECADKFGSQAITVALDVVKSNDGWKPVIQCGARITEIDAVNWALRMETMGAGELILTNIDRDGTMRGYDLDVIDEITDTVSIPVVANGGCGNYGHMHQALKKGASAVAAGAMFQWTEQTPKGAAEYLAKRGWETRQI